MRNTLLKLAVLGAFSFSQHLHAGWVSVPDTGFASSAYTSCYNTGRVIPYGGIANNTKGNFGSYPIASANYPSSSSNNTCWVAFSGSEGTLPAGKTGFSTTASTVRSIPNPVSGGASIGEVYDRYWRNSSTNMCIIGTRVRMFNVDSDSEAGTQYFEVNDVVRGGFADSGAVNIAYTISTSPSTSVSPVFRVGRTFTSVQHRALKYDTLANKAENGTNYLDIPTNNSVTAAITGEAAPIAASTAASTTLATQDAVVNANYIDFTGDSVYADDDGSTNAYSAFTYIEAPCSANPTEQAGAIRLRQTGQELATHKVIDMTGYAIGTP